MQANLSLTKFNFLSINSIESYISSIKNIPLMTKEEEYKHAKSFKETGNLDAAQQLILSHLRFVVHIAKGFAGYGLPQADLIQEGNVGLMRAVKKFDPEHGVRLASFAVFWIKSEIQYYVLNNWRTVKIATTKAQRKLFFNLRKNKSNKTNGQWFTAEETKQLAHKLDVPEREVKLMESRLSSNDEPFDLKDSDDDFTPADYFADQKVNLERDLVSQEKDKILTLALSQLNEREKTVISQRWLTNDDKVTLNRIAQDFGVTLERVRQIEAQAIKKMQAFAKDNL